MKRKEGFTVRLALADVLPVAFFGVAGGVLGAKLSSATFAAGVVICLLAGTGKIIWKFLIAVCGKDLTILSTQLRYLMPAGFLIMGIGAATADRTVAAGLFHEAVRIPALPFFLLALCGVAGMAFCAKRYERYDPRGNWIEQILNIASQGCVMAGVLFL